jgi:acetyl-CoA carboxylase carboxyltransferase component
VPSNWDASARRELVNEGRLGPGGRWGVGLAAVSDGDKTREVVVRAGPLLPGARVVVSAEVQHGDRGRVLSAEGAAALAAGADLAFERRLPLVLSLVSSGSDLAEGVAALDGWGRVARALARCS